MHKTSFMMALFALSRTTFAADFAPSVQWVKVIGGSGNTVEELPDLNLVFQTESAARWISSF